MFASASNTLVTGGNFVVHQRGVADGFELLQRAVAAAAFHNSGERFDPPKCHPHTRTAVIDKIMNWILGLGEEECEAVIMWLHGAAGAGKSAIAQTIAERCYALNLLLASFFFSRSDPSRNLAKYLIPTIAYQVATNLPSTRARIAAALERDPLIVEQSVEAQIVALLVVPLQNLIDDGHFNSSPCQRLIIIDGLDECTNPSMQCSILNTISLLFRRHHIPILFLVASRPESHISQVFNSKPLVDLLVRLPLDVDYRSADDVRLFLHDKFNEIKETHPLKAFIDPSWPYEHQIQALIDKSSGHFLYAATVARYVSSVRHDPTERLEIVFGVQPPQHSSDMPFAEIDSLYMHIFSAVENVEKVLEIVALIVDPKTAMTPEEATEFLGLKPGMLEMLLGDLSSIISVIPRQSMSALHGSLGDFLFDPLRSITFYLDMPVMNAHFAHFCFEHIKTTLNFSEDWNHLSSRFPFRHSVFWFIDYCKRATPSRALYDGILSLPLTDLTRWYHLRMGDWCFPEFVTSFLSYLKTLESKALLNHYINVLDDFLRPIVRSYYSSPELTLLLTFLHSKCKDIKHSPWVRVAPYLSWPLANHDRKGLRVYRWFISSTTHNDVFKKDFAGYEKVLLDFLEDPNRSGELALNEDRFSAAALCYLKYLCHSQPSMFFVPFRPSSNDAGIRRNTPWRWRKISIRDANFTRETRHLRRIVPNFSDIDTCVNPHHAGMSSWSLFYRIGLEHLPFLLERSGYSRKLSNFLRRRAVFAVGAMEHRGAMKRARAAIAKYLSTFDSNMKK